MKRALFALFLFSFAVAALCLEPVGMTVPFSMKAGLRAESASSLDVVAFPDSSFVKVHLDSPSWKKETPWYFPTEIKP